VVVVVVVAVAAVVIRRLTRRHHGATTTNRNLVVVNWNPFIGSCEVEGVVLYVTYCRRMKWLASESVIHSVSYHISSRPKRKDKCSLLIAVGTLSLYI
jgi:hypothetical protein